MPVIASMHQSDPRPMRVGIRTIRLAQPSAFEVIQGVRVASPERVPLWHELIKQSLFTPAGRARLARRFEPKPSA
jgi:hypothetical protein